MNRVTQAIKATYNFFSGDAITLSATLVAFALGAVLAIPLHASNALVAIAFVAIIAAGLVATLWREVARRPRPRYKTAGE